MAALGNCNFDRWKKNDRAVWKAPDNVRKWMSQRWGETGVQQIGHEQKSDGVQMDSGVCLVVTFSGQTLQRAERGRRGKDFFGGGAPNKT